MAPDIVAAAVVNGLTTGAVYALIAVGLTLVYGVLHIINFAHGAILGAAMFATYLAFQIGVDPYLAMAPLAVLFFALGLDRRVIAIVGASLKSAPPGAWQVTGAAGDAIARMGSAMFTMGLRLAMPVVGFLLLVDVGCAMAGRLSAQLQLLHIAFPAKLLAGLALLALVLSAVPQLMESCAAPVLASLERLVTR